MEKETSKEYNPDAEIEEIKIDMKNYKVIELWVKDLKH